VFTAPAAGWYRVQATFDVSAGTNGTTVTIAVMVDTTAVRQLNATVDSGQFQPVSLRPSAQLTAGQKISIGYRPTAAGRQVSLVNSNGVVPMLTVEETTAPS
jgi:hypothetical protein